MGANRLERSDGEPWLNDSEALSVQVSEVAESFISLDKDLKGNLAMSVIHLNSAAERGHFQGNQPFYPASVVKLFYMVYAFHWSEQRGNAFSDELKRAIRDMIVDSSNDATAHVVNVITATTDGPELGEEEIERWMENRQVVTEWFRAKGYNDVVACQKTWNEGPYGRERQGYGKNFELRNSLSANDSARLLAEIMTDRISSRQGCDAMIALLHRQNPCHAATEDTQAKDFGARFLPANFKLWSKAGWVSQQRHDVLAIETPNQDRWVFSIFTQFRSDDIELIGRICLALAKKLQLN